MTWVLAWLVRRSRPSDYAFTTMLLVSSATAFAFGNFPGLLLWALSGVGRPQALVQLHHPSGLQNRAESTAFRRPERDVEGTGSRVGGFEGGEASTSGLGEQP
jgi:hypothetical protein